MPQLRWSDYTSDGARDALRGWIAEALRREPDDGIEDYRLDLITEAAQRRDVAPHLVRLWIFDQPSHAFTAGDLTAWAMRRGFLFTPAERTAPDPAPQPEAAPESVPADPENARVASGTG